MSASSPVPKDHPLMQAWAAYQQTEDYANTRRWGAAGPAYIEGSLWAAFEQGFFAAGGARPFDTPDAAPARPTPEQIAPIAWLECRGCGSAPGHKAGCPGVVAEAALFEALSDALTGGNAGTWDEVIHAADQHCPKRGAITPEQIALVEARGRLERWRDDCVWMAGTRGRLASRVTRRSDLVPELARKAASAALDAQAIDDVLALLTAVTGKDTP